MTLRIAVVAALLLIAAAAGAANPVDIATPKVEPLTRPKLDVVWPGFVDREALVILTFDVLANGKVANIRLADGGFHEQRFVDAASRALKKSTWRPKHIDGQAVETVGVRQAFNFAIVAMEPGITKEFRVELDKVDDFLKKGDFAGGHFHAQWMLSEVVKLKYEYAVLQAQLARTYASVGRIREAIARATQATARPNVPWPEYLQLQATTPPNKPSNYLLSKEIVIALLEMRMRLLASKGLLLEAMQAYYEMAGLEMPKPDDPLAEFAGLLAAKIQGSDPLVGEIEIGESRGWRQYLSRRSFSLDKVEGAISYVHVRCSAKSQSFEFKPGVDWHIPVSWGICAADVEAEPGTTFNFVEFPDSPVATP
jgi:hypothetical protein